MATNVGVPKMLQYDLSGSGEIARLNLYVQNIGTGSGEIWAAAYLGAARGRDRANFLAAGLPRIAFIAEALNAPFPLRTTLGVGQTGLFAFRARVLPLESLYELDLFIHFGVMVSGQPREVPDPSDWFIRRAIILQPQGLPGSETSPGQPMQEGPAAFLSRAEFP